jgi:hypothetical protein
VNWIFTVTGCTPIGFSIALASAAVSAILVNAYQPTRIWKYVMWEGGVLEWLTALSFLFAGGLYLWLWRASREGGVRRAWHFLFGAGCLVLAGEELNWGRGMLVLNLDDPAFEARYNIQGGNLHNLFGPLVPVLLFVGLAGGLRITAFWSLQFVPLPVGFLNAVVMTALAVLFMDLEGDRFLLLDEVLEWSGATLILCLALHDRYGWFFSPGPASPPHGKWNKSLNPERS